MVGATQASSELLVEVGATQVSELDEDKVGAAAAAADDEADVEPATSESAVARTLQRLSDLRRTVVCLSLRARSRAAVPARRREAERSLWPRRPADEWAAEATEAESRSAGRKAGTSMAGGGERRRNWGKK